MKILITGINGMVASYLAEKLLKEGHEVIGTKRWQEDSSNIDHIKDKITMVDLNLNDLSNCIKVIEEHKPDAISHLAAESYVGDSFAHPIESVNVNGLGTMKLLEAIKMEVEGSEQTYNPIIHVCSSSEVYGLVKKEDIPIKETQIFNPSNPYACGKVLADTSAIFYNRYYGLKTIVTRMFTHTSRRRKMLSAEVAFAKQIAEFEKYHKESGHFKKFILKHGNLNSLRTWAHVEDAVKAYYLILTKSTKFGEVYNIGGLESKEIGEMLDYMISLSPLKKYIEKEQDSNLLRKYDVTLQLPNISKFQKDYPGWEANWKFKDIIKDVLEGQRKNV